MASFNVVNRPWIYVRFLDGHTDKLCLRDTLLLAHEIQSLFDPVVLQEYGVFRFLCAVIMDMIRPKDAYKIMDLLEQGKFSDTEIDAYIRLCEEEGTSFDLFDSQRPFLQAPYNEKYDKTRKSIANLNIVLPSGNNHIHFNHTLQADQVMEYDEAARALCTLQHFCTACTQHYPSTINGAPPLYCIYHGKNLYESLILSCITQSMASAYNMSYDQYPVLWRNTKEIVPTQTETEISVLFGMIYPSRRVLLIPAEDEKVHEVYLSQGMNYAAYDAWTDPHVVYGEIKDKRISIKPSADKEPWRNLETMFFSKHHSPLFVQMIRENRITDNICLEIYGVATNNAKYLDIIHGTLTVATSATDDDNKRTTIHNVLKRIEKQWEYMSQICRGFRHSDFGGKSLTLYLGREYFHRCQAFVLNEVLPSLANITESKQETALDVQYRKKVIDLCMNTYDAAVKSLSHSSKSMFETTKMRKKLLKTITKIED